jgi:hypothetical protein
VNPIWCSYDMRHSRIHSLTLATFLAIAATAMAGCGSMYHTVPPVQVATTMVTVVVSGTANDQLTEFVLSLEGITLTSQSGKTVNLLAGSQTTEFIHINSGIEPLISVSIPQDVYTSATATVGGASFSCVTLIPATGGLDTSSFGYGQTPTANVTVQLAAPIKVSGASMGLNLNLAVAQSATYAQCASQGGNDPYAITPTFNLTPIALLAQPTSPANGKVIGLNGQISAVTPGTKSFVVTLPLNESARVLSVSTAASAEYQGINGFSDLAVGTFVNLDGAVQVDGSLAATRISVEDPAATTVLQGPLLLVSNAEPALVIFGRQEQGALYGNRGVCCGLYFSFGSALFQISGQLANVKNLPFLPSFTAATMVAGQNVSLSTASQLQLGSFPYTPLSTVTLMPQVINGTISGTSSDGAFTIYTVELADYDLFPALAMQPGQTTLLNNPGEVQVYVDSDAAELNTQQLAVGNTLRFYGLVFNDNGTLRMDCSQINDGVAINPAASAAMQSHLEQGQAKVIFTGKIGVAKQTFQIVSPKP